LVSAIHLVCALGVAHLARGYVRIHTRIGVETEPMILEVKDGLPVKGDEVVERLLLWSGRSSGARALFPLADLNLAAANGLIQ
jgi:hypothetical protein